LSAAKSFSAAKTEYMSASVSKDPADRDVRDYLAAEQTFLSWIRTGLALMGFGVVLARFGQEMREINPSTAGHPVAHGLSVWFGITLVVTGVVGNVFAAFQHVRLVRQLNRGETQFTQPSKPTIVLALFLAAIGIGAAIYLLSV
jgi:putative membrane protein